MQNRQPIIQPHSSSRQPIPFRTDALRADGRQPRRKSSWRSTSLRRRRAFGCGRVYGADGDVITELAKGSRQDPGALLLSLGIRFLALLDKSNPLMQDLPKHAAESMGDCPDGGLIAQPW